MFEDYSAFIGFTNLPTGVDKQGKFYNNHIRGIFDAYLERVIKNNSNQFNVTIDESRKQFRGVYEPHPFYIFGQNDLAILSLIDDFEFPIRKFFPFGNTENYDTFHHQTYFGPCISFPNESNLEEFLSIEDYYLNYPLFGISQIKVSNTYLMSYGYELIKHIQEKIYASFKELNTEDLKIFFVFTYQWHEIRILYFSKTYESIFNLIPKIKCLKWKDIKGSFKNRRSIFYSATNNDNYLDSEDDRPIIKKFETILGFHLKLILDYNSLKQRLPVIIGKDNIFPECEWSCYPGETKNAYSFFSSLTPNSKPLLKVGRHDIVYTPGKENQRENNKVETSYFLDKFIEVLYSKELEEIISSVKTSLNYEPIDDMEYLPKASNGDYRKLATKYQNIITTKYAINEKEKEDINSKLKSSFFPRVTKDKFIKLLALYNSGIYDRDSYAFFIELHPIVHFLNNLFENEEFINYSTVFITELIEDVNTAIQQRLHMSYTADRIPDYNLYFKGGIQQLVTTYNGFLSTVSSQLNRPEAFVYFKGEPNVETNTIALKLNSLHLFHPSLLLHFGFQETSNSLLESFNLPNELNDRIFKDKYELTKNSSKILKQLQKQKGLKNPSDILDNKFFQHLFADIVTFALLYSYDFETFIFWHWGGFLTSPINYEEHSGIIDDRSFFILYMRSIIIKKRFENKNIFASNILDVFNNQILNDQEQKFKKLGERFVENMFNRNEFTEWLENIESHINTLIDPQDTCIKNVQKKQFSKLVNTVLEYQRQTRKRIIHDDGVNLYLERNLNSGQVKFSKNCGSHLFDRIGGIFTCHPMKRREYFKHKNEFLISLWDLSITNKGEKFRIDNELNES